MACPRRYLFVRPHLPVSPGPRRARASRRPHRLPAPVQPASPAPQASPADLEADLLARLRAGDDDAFAQFVREQTPALLRVTSRLLRSDDEARDAVQDAFVAAFRALPRFRAESRLGTWIYRIAINAALARLRARAHVDEVSLDELLPRFVDDGHQAEPSEPWPADAGAERREVRERVRAAIDRLPESYRTVVLLRDIEELTTDEAAQALGITTGALKVRLHRARQALRALLDPWMRGEAA
ncbi:RNA polymerase sigma-70 factor, ECF subfamily [bacterium JGI 053]|nr:RNA polymerase sigma-70 factor, ECF subfamily [bacterium JGI 053]